VPTCGALQLYGGGSILPRIDSFETAGVRMIRSITILAVSLTGAAALAQSARAAPADDLAALMDDYWAWVLAENPVLATQVGVRDYDNALPDPSLEAEDRRERDARQFLARLDAIPEESLAAEDQASRKVLRRLLAEAIEANQFGQRTMLFTTYSGWHQQFANLANDVPLATSADFESYLLRLKAYPKLNDAAMRVSDVGVADGHTLPCSVLNGFETTISGVITDDAGESRFFAPFLRPRPVAVSPSDFDHFAAETRATIETTLNPAYQKHLDWYLGRYRPACRAEVGISAQPGGADYYAFRIRQTTTTELDAAAIHELGLAEVERIRAEMEQVARAAGFASRAAFVAELRTSPKYYAATPEALMQATARQLKTIDGLMPTLFGRLPRLPYGIREIPAEIAPGTTTAYYNQGAPEVGLSGTYYVNTSKLDQRPLWEIPALSLHEAVPGHHHQIALQQELELPPFRKYAAQFTAFVEGWGLYAERLGIEMGIYDSPEKQMGRLSYEMWRACRLVVDTGMHARGWSKQQAIEFMKANTALTDANIEAEVNRYISWPGQALAYKLGELKIRELRARAGAALGERFDLRAFHDAVLRNGAVPLDVLEAEIEAWIAARRGAAR
jgi:uncharacterized protein (DUF885 family)